jgi:hypothetical protein
VTYDIVFIHRDLGQPFEAAVEAALRGDPLPDRLRTSWLERLQPVMRRTFGTAEVDDRSAEPEIRDPSSGLRLVVRGGGVVIEVPEDPDGDAVELMRRTYGLAKEVERVTGLEGYDTQLEEPISLFPATGPPPRPRTNGAAGAHSAAARTARPQDTGPQVAPGSLDPGDLPKPGRFPGLAGGSLWRDDDERATGGARTAAASAGARDASDQDDHHADGKPRRRWWRLWAP